jgi:hypothetical protein
MPQQFGDLGYGFFGQQGQNMPNPTGPTGINSADQQPQNIFQQLLARFKQQQMQGQPQQQLPGDTSNQDPQQQQVGAPLRNYYANQFMDPNSAVSQLGTSPNDGYTPNPYGYR